MIAAPRRGLLRPRENDAGRVTPIELFFDLVYVFAVTQLSAHLLAHLTAAEAARSMIVLLAVWWAWLYTSWITSWFSPNQPAVQALLISMMLVALVGSTAIDEAYDGGGLVFAGAYLTLQLGRTAFLLVGLDRGHELVPNFRRTLVWFSVSAVGWISGPLLGSRWQFPLWLAAITLDYLAPTVGFYTPGLGRSRTSEWTIEGGHLAERCQLFIILALGESILVIGATAAGEPASAQNVSALVIAFAGSAAMFWLYFDRSADAGAAAITATDNPARFAQNAYSYVHVIMVAGIIASAVGNELSITHPDDNATGEAAATLLGGPALYLFGHWLFKLSLGFLSWSRLAGIAALLALLPAAPQLPRLALLTAAALIITAVAASDAITHHRHPTTATPPRPPA